tara:strand:+ start:429 stop:698 length:270 start_codon:yes stop_codon:yes gene_type:complete
MKEEIYISVCWYDTLRYLGRYVNNRIMEIIEEEGLNKLDAIKILKVSPYLIKLAEEDHISKTHNRHTINESVIRKDHKGPNHDRWVTFS